MNGQLVYFWIINTEKQKSPLLTTMTVSNVKNLIQKVSYHHHHHRHIGSLSSLSLFLSLLFIPFQMD